MNNDKLEFVDEKGNPLAKPKTPYNTSEKIRNQKITQIQAATQAELNADNSPFQVLDNLQVSLGKFYNFKTMDILRSVGEKSVNLTVEVIGFAKLVQTICEADPDLSLGSIMIENSELYSIKHTIHTAIVCEIISKYLGWSTTDRLLLLAAVFTMNIAMIEVQDNFYYQEDPLTPAQKQLIRDHPAQGVELLVRNNVTNKIWLNIVAQHHESPDGSGYPRGLKGDQISLSAKIVSLSDMFCAKVVGRDYRKPLMPNEAMKSVFLSGRAKLENEFAMMFVKVLGIYPPGTIVRLANKEIAIVTHRGEKVNEPYVVTIIKPDGSLSPVANPRDCADPKFAIKEVIPWKEANVKVNRYQLWGYGMYKRTRVIKNESLKQIRNERRLHTQIPVLIMRSKEDAHLKGIIVDLTSKGCLLKAPIDVSKPWEANSDILLSFKLGEKIIKNLCCKIRSVKEDQENKMLGIQFIDIEAESCAILNSYIESVRKVQA
ncbi:MAG: PilZ domain-containing protein [Nitrospirae bacterium]|nr:PilZ domain-containing protein [Nitrospirota bacterium]MBF0541809.1 PilZ domain-containing protein [Nitrospirota bacterium]